MLGHRLDEALEYARRAHGDQVRKATTIPYIAHPMAALVLGYGGDEDQAIAALLHDVVEDCAPFGDGVPHATAIGHKFGGRVARIVLDCTDGSVEDKAAEGTAATPGQRREGWYARKRRYLGHLAGVGADTLLVSGCDKLHNARAIRIDLARDGGRVFNRFNAGREGILWYYRALADRFAELGTPVAGELNREVCEIERMAAQA